MPASRIPALDGTRALACLAVMAFHAHIPGASHGWLGVDVFFVLSGYLTARQLGDGRAAGRWLYRRWARLHPALLVLVTVVGPVAVVGGASVGAVAGAGLFLYVPWVTGRDVGLLGHTWTITVEVAGYVAAALVLPWLLRYPRRAVAALLAVLAVAAYVCLWEPVRLVRPEGILAGWALGALPPVPAGRWLERAARPLTHPLLVAVGARTYSLYLWHLPVFLTLKFHTGLTGVVLVAVEFAVAFAAAEASYRWVERPARERLYRALPRRALVTA